MRNVTLLSLCLAATACATKGVTRVPPPPVIALPTEALSGSTIAVFPLTTMGVDTVLGWGQFFVDRRQAFDRVDSILTSTLNRRIPQITWLPPAELRRAAAKAPGLLTDPDQMALHLLQTHALASIPDPLASQLRQLAGVATGGRYIIAPANLWFEHVSNILGRVRIVVALADVRRGAISWSATVSGTGETPWEAIRAAALQLTAPDVQ